MKRGRETSASSNNDGKKKKENKKHKRVREKKDLVLDDCFTSLPDSFRRVFHLCKFSSPRPVQQQAWPRILQGSDILCIAPTGSGKTLAFTLPALEHCISRNAIGKLRRRYPSVLVLVPTRELAVQVQSVANRAFKAFGGNSMAVYGGKDRGLQVEHLQSTAIDMVIATPGRALDLVGTNDLILDDTSMLILDECDRMLDLGFEPQIVQIMNSLKSGHTGDLKTQNILFSATFPEKLQKVVMNLGFLKNKPLTLLMDSSSSSSSKSTCSSSECVVLQGCPTTLTETKVRDSKTKESTDQAMDSKEEEEEEEGDEEEKEQEAEDQKGKTSKLAKIQEERAMGGRSFAESINAGITQIVHVCAEHKKPRKLIQFIEKVRKEDKQSGRRVVSAILIFCTKIKTVKFVESFLQRQNVPKCVALHGKINQDAREKALNDFKAGKARIMVATDVAGRGIDISGLPFVVNYDFPVSLKTYVHRIGRTGRNGKPGTAFSFFTRNLAPLAKDLVQVLEACKQTVDPNLRGLVETPLESVENQSKRRRNQKRRDNEGRGKVKYQAKLAAQAAASRPTPDSDDDDE